MTTNQNTPMPPHSNDPLGHLDADLRALAAGLDALGAADGASAAEGLEKRVLAGVMTELRSVAPVAAAADSLGMCDRNAAREGLERRVHEASRPALHGAATPGLRLAGGDADVVVVRRAWWARGRIAAAAALLLVGAAVALQVARTGGPADVLVADSKAIHAAKLDAEVEVEMDRLFGIMSDADYAGTASRTAEEATTDELVNWLSQGASS